jgi:hypothetical protein
MTSRQRWWLRGFLLVAQVGCLGVGCTSGPQLTSLNGNVNGLIPSALRYQKPDEVITASAVSLPPTTLADGTIAVRAIAYVNNSPIFENEWRDAVTQRAREWAELPELQQADRRKLVELQELDHLIEREVIMDAAMAHLKKMKSNVVEEMKREANKEFDKRLREIKTQFKVQNDEQLKQLFAAQGMTLDSLHRHVERNFITTEYMRNLIFPKIQSIALSEIREYYDTHADEFQEQDRVKWQALFVDAGKFPNRPAARQYAEQVVAQLRGGADFAATAKKLRDSGVNILLSDQGVGEKRGEIQPPEVQATLLQLRMNEIGTPVELPGGYYVIRTTERSYAGRKPFTVDLQADIRRRLINIVYEREFHRHAEQMKAKAVIQKLITP